MPPLPKRKISHARQAERRQQLKLKAQALMQCPHCQNPKMPHTACPTCGYYNGREAVAVESKEKKKKKSEK
jgi:large subunit ribosomal protein L32